MFYAFGWPDCSIVIGMLEGDDRLLPCIKIGFFVNALVEDSLDPGNAGVVVDLDLRGQVAAIVERADRQFEAARVAVGHRRAAVLAKAALDIDRRLEIAGFAACPLHALVRRGHKGGKEAAELLLTHAAMADRGAAKLAAGAESDRAALAAAGTNGFAHADAPVGQCAVSWSGCW